MIMNGGKGRVTSSFLDMGSNFIHVTYAHPSPKWDLETVDMFS